MLFASPLRAANIKAVNPVFDGTLASASRSTSSAERPPSGECTAPAVPCGFEQDTLAHRTTMASFQGIDYYDLAFHTDPALGVSVHTVMFYPLEGAARVYAQQSFAHKRCLMQKASGAGRPLTPSRFTCSCRSSPSS